MSEAETCECGWPSGTFACKIRHVAVDTSGLRAAREQDR